MSKIEDAVVDFITNKGTFYASLLSQMKRTSDPKGTETMKVQIKNGRVNLFYNPDFIEPRTMKDTKAILEHECLHIVMEHHARFAKSSDHSIAKVATDLAINQMIQHIPEDAITIDTIFGPRAYNIHKNEQAEYYYDEIMKDEKLKKQIKQMMGEGEGQDGQCDGSCKPDPNGKPSPNAKPHSHGCGNDFKNSHDGSDLDEGLQREIVKQMVKEAMSEAKKTQGHMPSQLEQYIEELFKPPKVSWQQILRKFVSTSIKSGHKSSWKKPSRRYGETQKGRIADRTVSLVVVIDTSGSIDDGMLEEFITEIKGIQRCYKSDIHMIECDAEVGKYYKMNRYGKVDRQLTGRGGTSFKPPFKYVKEKSIRCDALIYFTDLCGDFPSHKPSYPVLWGYYNCGWGDAQRVPFGHVLTLEKEKQK